MFLMRKSVLGRMPEWELTYEDFGKTDGGSELLFSFQTYRQLSGWNLPPLVIRAVRAHCQD